MKLNEFQTELLKKVKILLKIDEELYDEELMVELLSAIAKMEIEGVPELWILNNERYTPLYSTCLSYFIATSMDMEVDINKYLRYYTTNVNLLRMYIRSKNA